jgi:hypothetical protein
MGRAALLPELIVPFKRDMYRAILDGFAEHLAVIASEVAEDAMPRVAPAVLAKLRFAGGSQ